MLRSKAQLSERPPGKDEAELSEEITSGRRLTRLMAQPGRTETPAPKDFSQFIAPAEKQGPFTVVYVGELRPYMGLPVLLKACHGLANVRLWIIGDGSYAATCRSIADSLDLPQLTFWGSVAGERALALLKQSHVLVLPSISRNEALNSALSQGMAAGNVPVASDLPAIAEMIVDDGFVFPTGDHQALRAILIRLRDDPTLRVRKARMAQQRAQLFFPDPQLARQPGRRTTGRKPGVVAGQHLPRRDGPAEAVHLAAPASSGRLQTALAPAEPEVGRMQELLMALGIWSVLLVMLAGGVGKEQVQSLLSLVRARKASPEAPVLHDADSAEAGYECGPADCS